MIKLESICKSYGSHQILKNLNLQFRAGEVHMLMGNNGAGKTTLARILAGLELSDSGGLISEDMKIMLIQQDFVIWPELTVLKNMSVAADKKTSKEWLERTGLLELSKAKAGKLSHGQKQRLSIARAMAFQPQVLIIDEAFSYLDPAQACDAKNWIIDALHDDHNQLTSIIWITQSSEEAFAFSDRLSIIENGEIIQAGTSETIYHNPTTLAVASMMGKLSALPYTAWKACKDLLILPEPITELLPDDSLIFRPEWCTIEETNDKDSGFKVIDSRFHPHGYVVSLSLGSHAPIQVQSENLPDEKQTYRLVFKQAPLILPSL